MLTMCVADDMRQYARTPFDARDDRVTANVFAGYSTVEPNQYELPTLLNFGACVSCQVGSVSYGFHCTSLQILHKITRISRQLSFFYTPVVFFFRPCSSHVSGVSLPFFSKIVCRTNIAILIDSNEFSILFSQCGSNRSFFFDCCFSSVCLDVIYRYTNTRAHALTPSTHIHSIILDLSSFFFFIHLSTY